MDHAIALTDVVEQRRPGLSCCWRSGSALMSGPGAKAAKHHRNERWCWTHTGERFANAGRGDDARDEGEDALKSGGVRAPSKLSGSSIPGSRAEPTSARAQLPGPRHRRPSPSTRLLPLGHPRRTRSTRLLPHRHNHPHPSVRLLQHRLRSPPRSTRLLRDRLRSPLPSTRLIPPGHLCRRASTRTLPPATHASHARALERCGDDSGVAKGAVER